LIFHRLTTTNLPRRLLPAGFFYFIPMEGKKSFILYCDLKHAINELTDDQAGKLLKIILQYVNDENPVIEDQVLKVAFTPIKLSLKRDLEEWKKTCERNKINGDKGGRPSKTQKTQSVLEKPKETDPLISKPKKPDNDNDNDNESDNDIYNHNEIFKKLWINRPWLESLAMLWKREIKEIHEHLNKFRLECISKADYKANEKDAKEHFVNWTKYNPLPDQGYVYKRPDLSSLERNPF
jgi:hypothetical protein